MNKKLLVGMFSTIMALAPWSGYAAQTIDAPHRTVDSTNLATEDDCTSCHFTNYDVTLPEGACERCHKANTPPYGDTIAPVVMTHKNLKCQACHNPHVSLQASGIAGAFTGVTYDAVNNKSTLAGVSPTPDASWAAKTGAERGMIMWITAGADNLSYEVKAIDATANTVTVSGNVTTTAGAFDLRRGQLIAKKVSKTAGNSYRQGDLAVQFPSAGSSSIFVDTVNATSPTGVCQVCHTLTAHWTSSGAGTNHNATRVCTECHTHDTGFLVTACNACHQGYGLDGVPVDVPGLAQPPTGSVTAGQHQIHAVDYAMPCTTCHFGTGMDRLNNPTNPVTDDKIQIGFSHTKYPQGYLTTYDGQSGVTYEGTNHTTVSNTGTMSCGTVYCHSNGHSVRMNCATAITNSSLKWDGSSSDPQGDTVKCNNCHGFKTGAGLLNPMISARHIGPHSGYDCYYCHADTVDATNAISAGGRANHANGVYNVTAGGGLTFTYDSTTKKCSAGSCHPGAYTTAWNGPSTTYPSGYTDPESCPDPCGGIVNQDPIIEPYGSPVSVSDAFVYANDPNTLHYKITASDPDANDAVVAQCRGGGHTANATSFIRTVVGGGLCQNFTSLKLNNDTLNSLELSCRFTDAKLATSKNMCFNFAMADNDPASYNLLAGYNWVVPAGQPNDGLAKPAAIVCVDPTVQTANKITDDYGTLYNNIVPEVTKTVSVTGKTVSITFTAKDADQVDSVKQTYWKGIYPTKTGGHAASTNHYIQINWSNEGQTIENKNPGNTNALQLTASGGQKTYTFNYDNLTTPIGTNDGAAVTTRTGPKAPGSAKLAGNGWIRAYICDNHVLGVENNMGKQCYDSGWFNVVFQ